MPVELVIQKVTRKINQRPIFSNDVHSVPCGTGTRMQAVIFKATTELERQRWDQGKFKCHRLAILTKIQLFFWNRCFLNCCKKHDQFLEFRKELIMTVLARFLVVSMEGQTFEEPYPTIFTKIQTHPFFSNPLYLVNHQSHPTAPSKDFYMFFSINTTTRQALRGSLSYY